MRAAVIDSEGLAWNVVALPDDYDPKVRGAWVPPDGLVVKRIPDDSPVAPGWVLRDGQWLLPEYAAPVDPVAAMAAELAAVRAALEDAGITVPDTTTTTSAGGPVSSDEEQL